MMHRGSPWAGRARRGRRGYDRAVAGEPPDDGRFGPGDLSAGAERLELVLPDGTPPVEHAPPLAGEPGQALGRDPFLPPDASLVDRSLELVLPGGLPPRADASPTEDRVAAADAFAPADAFSPLADRSLELALPAPPPPPVASAAEAGLAPAPAVFTRSPTPGPCVAHPARRAPLYCPACGRLCVECAGCAGRDRGGVMRTDLYKCRRCGGIARPITTRRRAAWPLRRRLADALAYPLRQLSPEGLSIDGRWTLALYVGVLAMMEGLSVLPGLGSLGMFEGGLAWGMFCHVVATSAHGVHEFTNVDLTTGYQLLVRPAFRLLLTTSLTWVPPILYALFGGGIGDDDRFLARLVSPMGLGLFLLGLPLLLAGVIASVLETPVHRAANPLVLGRVAVRLGRDYLQTSAVGLVLLLALGPVFAQLHMFSIPVGFVREAIRLLVLVVLARLIGTLVHARGDELGFGADSEYDDPAEPALLAEVPMLSSEAPRARK